MARERANRTSNTYSRRFFADQATASARSAEVVLRLAFDLLRPATIIDVGCGTGAWLATARTLGATGIAVDGEYARPSLLIDSAHFVARDLERGLDIDGAFDLGICVEVAEHLSDAAGRRLVRDLARVATSVVFSAAIPGQGGTNHINERWQSHWHELFRAEGMHAVDTLREPLWWDERVEPWYAQNVVLYTSDPELAGFELCPFDLVNPRLWELSRVPPPPGEISLRAAALGARRAVRLIPQAAANSAARSIGTHVDSVLHYLRRR